MKKEKKRPKYKYCVVYVSNNTGKKVKAYFNDLDSASSFALPIDIGATNKSYKLVGIYKHKKEAISDK